MPSRRLLEHKNLHSSSGVARLRKCMNLEFKILSSQSLTLYNVYILTLKFSRHKTDVLSCRHLSVNFCFTDYFIHTWYQNKVRQLIAVKVLHTSLLNTAVVAFKVLPLGSYAPMPAPSPPFKTILELVLWNGLQICRS